MLPATALSGPAFLASVAASRATLGRPSMKLLDMVDHVGALTDGAPYAIVGGLAQMLWARKTHTEDLDVALLSDSLRLAYERIAARRAEAGWTLPDRPDRAHEANDVFEVYHLLFDGSVVDLLTFSSPALTSAIIDTAVAVPELGSARFACPELLLVTQLLRPGSRGALAALDLVVARQELGGFDVGLARTWARTVGREHLLDRTLTLADTIRQSS